MTFETKNQAKRLDAGLVAKTFSLAAVNDPDLEVIAPSTQDLRAVWLSRRARGLLPAASTLAALFFGGACQ
jgi:hypothetical protein